MDINCQINISVSVLAEPSPAKPTDNFIYFSVLSANLKVRR